MQNTFCLSELFWFQYYSPRPCPSAGPCWESGTNLPCRNFNYKSHNTEGINTIILICPLSKWTLVYDGDFSWYWWDCGLTYQDNLGLGSVNCNHATIQWSFVKIKNIFILNLNVEDIQNVQFYTKKMVISCNSSYSRMNFHKMKQCQHFVLYLSFQLAFMNISYSKKC